MALTRRVTAFTAACVLVSNMIGTGIFGTTGFMAADLGRPWLILSLWAAGALFSLLGAFCYAELGASWPRAGGEYVYIREAYGRLPGFLSGWMSLSIGFSAAIATNAHLFADYLRQLFPVLLPTSEAGWQARLEQTYALELAMVWGLTAVHAAGVGPGGALQRALTIFKVAAMLLLIAAGLALGNGDWSHLGQSDPSVGVHLNTALVSFMFVTFSYSGWNAASYLAEEMVEPARNLPRAMIWGTLAVGALYLAMNVTYLYALPVAQLAADPIEPVGHKTATVLLGGETGRWFSALLGVSILGAASAMIWAGPRVYFAMARDGVFPAYFARTGAQSHAPVGSIVLQSAWVSVLVVTGSFEALVRYATFALIAFAGLAVAAVIVMRRRAPDHPRPYRVPGYPWTPVVFLIVSAAILVAALQLSPRESLLGVVTILAGIPLYFLWRRSPSAPDAAEPGS